MLPSAASVSEAAANRVEEMPIIERAFVLERTARPPLGNDAVNASDECICAARRVQRINSDVMVVRIIIIYAQSDEDSGKKICATRHLFGSEEEEGGGGYCRHLHRN